MLPEYHLPDKQLVAWKPVSPSSPENIDLPGSTVYSAIDDFGTIRINNWANALYQIGIRIFNFIRGVTINISKKREGVRFEAVLEGSVQILDKGQETDVMKEGYYRISDIKEFQALFKSPTATRYFVTYYSPEVLQQIGIEDEVSACPPRILAPEMAQLIINIMGNSYEGGMRDFFYENCIRELLFIHLSIKGPRLPGELSDTDLAAIFKADELIKADLKSHYTIRELARKVGINEFKLKQGFRKMFQQGVFKRLTEHRMQHAKILLESTDRSVEDIADRSGYSNASTLIPAFSKRFGHSPHEWRKLRRKGMV